MSLIFKYSMNLVPYLIFFFKYICFCLFHTYFSKEIKCSYNPSFMDNQGVLNSGSQSATRGYQAR